jgi:redox-sensing transcriptional repressor
MTDTNTMTVRLLEYRTILKKLKGLGLKRVFSSNLADSIGISASLVRKDFSILTTSGNKRGGYRIDELLSEITRMVRRDTGTRSVIVGIGKLGMALLNYPGFDDENLQLVAGFDSDPAKLTQNTRVPVYPVESLPEYVARNDIRVGVLAVPPEAVQQTADIMVMAGVKGFLNFVPRRLVLPAGCYENHINLAMELEKVVLRIHLSETAGKAT